ncbi:nucleoside-diphosphate kinase [Peteryoungia ipomoeae]|uniref:Nucleoside-diphosphate kinase n=1 Tax=Peteryoungia ipomoeae TaxID=1210932 RepID=A0A4V4HM57_9HYPH|nr:nucleoside-diphosphate kinase [Peteryoungia ipomoeae]THV20846.1 nucleoside-diphosphate kinase [Peteryoungia ipomoeae]
MSNGTYILTTKDFSILEALCDNWHGRDDRLLVHIRHKINSATVVFRDDLPREVASINSRVRFRVNGGESDARVISTGQVDGPVGMFLPITTLRGLALLGLREGQEITIENIYGDAETIMLDAVEYQPETSRRERHSLSQDAVVSRGKTHLRLVSGGMNGRDGQSFGAADGFDDPGPSAA